MRESYLALAERARQRLKSGKDDTGVPEVQDAKTVVSNMRRGPRKPR
jgi:hypothetical protein